MAKEQWKQAVTECSTEWKKFAQIIDVDKLWPILKREKMAQSKMKY